MLLAKVKLDTIEGLTYKALIDSYINPDEFISVKNVLKEYYEMKEKLKILKMLWNIPCKNDVLRQL